MAQTKKTTQKTLPPVKNKAVVKSTPTKMPSTGEFFSGMPAKQVIMTSQDIKNVMMENQELRKEVERLKKDNEMLGKILLTAGITVDEKFGDAEIDEVRVPSMKEVAGYKEVDGSRRGNFSSSTPVSFNNDEDDDIEPDDD